MSFSAQVLFGMSVDPDQVATVGSSSSIRHVRVRNHSDYREVTLLDPQTGQQLLHFAAVYGFRHLQNLVRKLKNGRCPYHYVEIAACPGACSNGGGQLRTNNTSPKSIKEWANEVEETYRANDPTQTPVENTCHEQHLA